MVGGLIESATDGWGMNGWFFGLPWIWESGAGRRVPVQLRRRDALLRDRLLGRHDLQALRRARGSRSCSSGVGALFVLGLWVVGRLDAWGVVFEWFAAQGVVGLSLWGIVLGAVLAASAFLTLRRAVP